MHHTKDLYSFNWLKKKKLDTLSVSIFKFRKWSHKIVWLASCECYELKLYCTVVSLSPCLIISSKADYHFSFFFLLYYKVDDYLYLDCDYLSIIFLSHQQLYIIVVHVSDKLH